MFDKSLLQKPAIRHYVRVVAFVVLTASLLLVLMREAYPYIVTKPQPEVPAVEVTPSLEPLSREFPVRLRIPTLDIDVPFEAPLGLNEDRTIQVPDTYDSVGWYSLGAAPGEMGTASILGHVDSYEGAAVFYYLGKLNPGDRIYVDRADGVTATFEVELLERYKQSEFPNEKVYGMTEYPSLRLITCSGTYLKGERRYTHNLVVYARLTENLE